MSSNYKILVVKYLTCFFFVVCSLEVFSIHDPLYICRDDGAVFFMDTIGLQGTPNSWEWTIEGGSISKDFKQRTNLVTYHTAGTFKTYNKTGFVGGGFDYDTFVIVVVDWPMPAFYFPSDTAFCSGSQITFNTVAYPPYLTYKWSTGETTQSTSVNSSGIYTVTLQVMAGTKICQTIQKQGNVTESISPVVKLPQDKTMCQNQSISLDAGAGTAYKYAWTPNGETSRFINVSLPGIYRVKVTNADGCSAEDEIELIDSCPHTIFVPNAVSPNEDLLNDVFVKIWNFTPKDYTFRIYNRWGELLFETTDLLAGWNCKVNDVPVQQDIYVYKITYFDNDKKWYEMRGTFFVVR
jgi:gliding motility-associated-like protein